MRVLNVYFTAVIDTEDYPNKFSNKKEAIALAKSFTSNEIKVVEWEGGDEYSYLIVREKVQVTVEDGDTYSAVESAKPLLPDAEYSSHKYAK